ncbi:MAG TPA: hypothetical protein VEQ87_11485 [Burkholderiales bacterium]|nr:hypothetical protein [Burkholderiales bacterium]
MKRAALCTLLVGAGVALGACTSMGGGSGFAAPGNEAVNFSWKSDDGSGTSGRMSATLADGTIFSGDYLEITRQAASPELEPEWNRWDRGVSDLVTEEEMPAFGSSTLYSGRVLANLRSGDGQRMRCRFHLNVPSEGMAGGGQGKCDLPNGGSVDAVFPRT